MLLSVYVCVCVLRITLFVHLHLEGIVYKSALCVNNKGEKRKWKQVSRSAPLVTV